MRLIILTTLLLVFSSIPQNHLLSQSCTDANSGTLTFDPPLPTDGTNLPGGTVVEMCFTLNEFNTPSINWLQSIIPTFGPGFDFSTFTVTSLPNACSAAGSWGWFDPWTACASGQMFGPGFSFDGSAGLGCGGTPNDGDPGNNYGDQGAPCPSMTWCWELTTVPVSPFSCAVLNYNTQINVYGDAETGTWDPPGGPPCLFDEPLCVPGLENLMVTQDPTPCGCTVISATWDGQLIGQNCGLDIQWSGPGGFSSNELENEVCVPGAYTLTIGVTECVAYELTEIVQIVGTPATVTLTAMTSPVCVGDEITFMASDLGPGANYEWDIEGEDLMGQTVTITATGGGLQTANFAGTDANGCFVEESINFIVLPLPVAIIQLSDDMVCEDENVTVSGIAPGMTTWDFDGAIVNSGSGNGPYDLSFPGPGTYTVRFTTDNGTCADTSYQDIVVFELYESPVVECFSAANDSIVFSWTPSGGSVDYELVLNGGTPFTVSDTFYGVGQIPSGATVTLEVSPVSNGVCPDPAPGLAMCTAFNCPDDTLQIYPTDTFWCPLDTPFVDTIFLSCSFDNFDTLVDVTWSGDAVYGNVFIPDSAVIGDNFVYLEVTTADSCVYYDTVVYVQGPLVTGTIIGNSPICFLESSTITYVGTAPTDGSATFDWDFGGGSAVPLGNESYDVTFPGPGIYQVFVIVEYQGCICPPEPIFIEVLGPPDPPIVSCGGGSVDSVSFNWLPVDGAFTYQYAFNGGPLQSTSQTSAGIGGLMEGDVVTIEVFAIGDCGISEATTFSCVAEACPDLTLEIDDSQNEFCLGDDPDFIVLEIALNSGSGTGNYTWSGPGVSNDTFYVADAGPGVHEIIVAYDEGICNYGDTTTFTVFDIPVADFSLSDTVVCIDALITVTNEVANIPSASYAYDFPGGIPASVTGYGPHQVSYAAAGTYTITLTVTNNGCDSTITREIEVEEPLMAPVVTCDQTGDLQSITINWTAVTPNTGYEITVDGMVTDTVTGLSFTLNNLSPSELHSFSVRALSDAACGDGPASAPVECATLDCPDISLTPAAAQTEFCFADADPAVLLSATSSGGDMTGTFSWSGPGVNMVGPDFTFDPSLAGVGAHWLIVDYVETAGCSGQDSLLMNVYGTPAASFSLLPDTVCSTSATVVTYTGATGPDVTLNWNFSGAMVNPLGGETYELSWANAGTYTVQLTVSENGCDSTVTNEVTVVEPLGTIDVTCTLITRTSITFGWDAVPGAVGYEISLDGTVVDTVTDLSFTTDFLSPGVSVTITVTPVGTGPCGDGPADTQTCVIPECPDISVNIGATQTDFCFGEDTNVIDLTAVVSGTDSSGVFSWDGNGITASGNTATFDPSVAGVGTHAIAVLYQEVGDCIGVDTILLNVFAIPSAAFVLATDTICSDASTIVTYSGLATSSATFNWDFDGATVTDLGGESYELSWTNAGTYTITLNVSENGCDSTTTQTITVVEPLAAIDVSCTQQTLTSVTFGWDAVPGALGYEVNIGGVMDTVTSLTYLVDMLSPGQTITVTVTPLGEAPCGNGPADSESCTSLNCPSIVVAATADQTSFCLGGNATSTVLVATSSGGDMTGTFAWSGPGVTDDGTTASFDPVTAGVGTHQIIVNYVETAGCSGSDTLIMNVFAVPTADVSLSADTICSDASTVISYVGTATAAATYTWNFDGATVNPLGDESYELSWTSGGTYTISLSVSEAGCSSDTMIMVVVEEPLDDPAPSCEDITITSVSFSWPAVAGATGYSVSIDGSLPIIIDSTTYTVDNLDENTTVSLTLIALGDDPCGNSSPVMVSCTSDPCPDVSLVPSAPQTAFCGGVDNTTVPLDVTVSGSTGGTVTWSGTGVEADGMGGFVFNPAGLTAATYTLTATYQESVCSYSETLTVVIDEQPSADFALAVNAACTGSTVMVSLVGSPMAGASYDWDFDGATVIDMGNQTYELSWAEVGDHSVSLVVDNNGCVSSFTDNVEISEPPTAGQQVQPAAVCQGSGDQIDLNTLVQGADAGGVWSPAPGAPAAVDPTTGLLNTNILPAGTYQYLYTVAGGVCPDASLAVSVLVEPAPVANAGANQSLTCTMGMVSLDGSGSTGSGNLTYLWTGPDGNPIPMDADRAIVDVAAPGQYTLTVTSEIGCSATATVLVDSETEVPVPQVELSNPSCFSSFDGTILVSSVDGGAPPYRYALNGAEPVPGNFFTGLEQGEYSLRVTDANGCFTELFLGLTQPDELSISITLPNDQNEYDEGEQVTLTANISGGATIDTLIWSPDSLNQLGEGTSNTITFLADETRTIGVTVLDENGCAASDQTTILVRKERSVYFPTGFSPNGDNSNDILFIGADPEKVELIQEFLVFNRWGESVFENYDFLPNDPVQGWDGTHRGETLNPEVFVYVAKVLFKNGDVVIYKGDVTLLR